MTLLKQIKDAIRENYILIDEIDRVIQAFDEHTIEIDLSIEPLRLAHDLTGILREVTSDKHFALSYRVPDEIEEVQPSGFAPPYSRNNNYFYTAKRLYGNVGYLDFRLFPDHREAMETAIGAMAMLAHTDALIYDIRLNRGGSPRMIQLLLSYLFKEPTHLISFESRTDGDNWQTWTMPYVPGRQYLDKPVYVLTSGFTGSAAEEFAYDIQQLERGTLVGQTTAGAGHLVTSVELSDGFSVYVSNGRPVSPISKTGWEGVGVVPHIETEVGDELRTAHLHVLDTLIEQADTDDNRQFLEWEKQIAVTSYAPYIPDDIACYIGHYENTEIIADEDGLTYVSNGVVLPMTPIAEATFIIHDGDMRLMFRDDELLIEWRDRPDKLIRRKTG